MLEEKPSTPQETDPDLCDLCGHRVAEVHCKVRCSNCGYTRDCSDP